MSEKKTEDLAEGFGLIDGPRWRGDRLWFSDILGGKVYSVGLDGDVEMVVEVPGQPSGLGFLPDGTLLIASMKDRRLLRLEDGKLICHAELASLVTGDLNDMVVDAFGRAYVGNFGFDVFGGASFKPANLVMVSPDGEAQIVAKDLAVANGSVITPDGKVMIVAETQGRRLTAFNIGGHGTLSDRRVFADLGEYGPDGICLDQQGAVWVGAFYQSDFLRVTEGGRITNRIHVGNARAVACTLGGDDMRSLLLLTCAGTWEEIRGRKGRGRVEITKVEIPGTGSP